MDILTQFLDDLCDTKKIQRLNLSTEIFKTRDIVRKHLTIEPLRPIIVSGEVISESMKVSPSSLDKNRIPFKSCLFIFDDYTLSMCSFPCKTTYTYLYEISPEYYYVQNGFTHTIYNKPACQVGLVKAESMYSADNFKAHANRGPVELNFILHMSYMFVQAILSIATSNDYKLLEHNSQYRIQYRNFARRLIGKTIYTNECLYIGKKKSLENSKFKDFKIINKPQFASEVMGHWRRLPERCVIGHDREGKEILDWTWVRPYIKGEGDLKVKSRIIQS